MQRAEQAVDVTQRSIVTVVEDWTGDDVTRRSIVTVVEGWTRVNVTQRSIVTVVFFSFIIESHSGLHTVQNKSISTLPTPRGGYRTPL